MKLEIRLVDFWNSLSFILDAEGLDVVFFDVGCLKFSPGSWFVKDVVCSPRGKEFVGKFAIDSCSGLLMIWTLPYLQELKETDDEA